MRKKCLFLQKLEHIGHSNAWLPCLNSNYKITHTTHRKLKYGIFCSTETSLVKVDFILKDNGKKQLGPEKGKRSFLIHHFQCSNQLCLIICGSSPKSIEAYTYPNNSNKIVLPNCREGFNWSLSLQFQLEASNRSKLWKEWH